MLISNITECFKSFDTVISRKGNKRVEYINFPVWSFDIETSSYINNEGEKQSLMYIFQIGSHDKVYTGRTWNDFINTYKKIIDYYKLELNKRHLIIWVHNLSYEFQFIRKFFEWNTVFSREKRKVIYALTTDGVEFRCSYMLSGLSLENTAKQCTSHSIQKKKGDLDYKIIRTPLTPLTKKEMGYCENDILCVNYYIEEQINLYGSITKIPYTNTGRVRKVLKEKAYIDPMARKKTRMLMNDLICTSPDELSAWNEAFSGGFTHASHLKSGKVFSNVASYDFTSSYPAVMLAEKYPMSRGIKKVLSLNEIIERSKKDCCYIIRLKVTGLLTTFEPESYLSYSKTRKCKNPGIDNGRIYSADSFETTLTDVDLENFLKVYDFDSIEVLDCYEYYKAYLPYYMVRSILDFYKYKTELKGVPGEYNETMYMLNKGMLNSCFGCSAQKLDNDNIIYNNLWKSESVDPLEAIQKYNSNKNRVLFFPWAIFITAYARRNLWTGILECGNDYIYSDTDSIKCLNHEKHGEYFDAYNKEIAEKIKECLKRHNINEKEMKPKTVKGVCKQIGVWDYEGTYQAFKTLGAKRYIYMEDFKIHLTISGVSKKTGSEYLTSKGKYNAFKLFNDGLVFPCEYSGRLVHTYIDEPEKIDVFDYNGVRYVGEELTGIHLSETNYTMDMNETYLQLIGLY